MALSTTGGLGYFKLSVSTATTLAAAVVAAGGTVPSGVNGVLLVPETQAIRWRDDGSAPSATDGMPVATGVLYDFRGDVSKLRLVAQASTSTVHVSFYSARNP